MEMKIIKQNEKLRNALEAGARIAEKSVSKIAWDIGHDKVKVTSGKLDYRVYQVLDYAADMIAQEHWFGVVLGIRESAITEEPDRFLIVISFEKFKKFIGNESLCRASS